MLSSDACCAIPYLKIKPQTQRKKIIHAFHVTSKNLNNKQKHNSVNPHFLNSCTVCKPEEIINRGKKNVYLHFLFKT